MNGIRHIKRIMTSLRMHTLVALALTLALGALAGCGGKADSGASSSPAPAASGSDATTTPPQEANLPPLQLSMLVNFIGEPPQEGSDVEKMIEAYTNTDLQVQWVSDLNRKRPVVIASGDMPKVLTAELKVPYMINAMRAGTFWDLTDYIQDYPNLAKVNPLIYKNISLDGRTYGLPLVRPISRFAITYRKDWADKLGLQEPQTLDDFYNMLKAFAKDDPDGNGKDDTYGIVEQKAISIIYRVALWLGAPNEWGVKDGKFYHMAETDEFLEALKWVKKIYDEKLINSDFAVVEKTTANAMFTSGKAGMRINITDGAFKFGEELKKNIPEGQTDMFSRLPGLNGGVVDAENGTNGIFVFPKSSVKTEAELKQVLTFFDKLGDERMATLFRWGIEGEHYKLNNGKPEFIDEQAYTAQVTPYRKLMSVDDSNALEGNLPPMLVKEAQLNEENQKYVVANPTEPLISDTFSEKGSQLMKIIDDAKVKFVMGKIDENGWKQALAQWRSSGGDKVAEEYAQSYAQTNP